MIDTHAHIWFDKFDADRDQVIARAQAAGVHTLINVGCDVPSSKQSVTLAEQYDCCYATVGLHPNDGHLWKGEQTIDELRTLVKSSKKVVAIGETGIDYFRSADRAELQQTMFRGQCLLAQEFDLPVIVHLRLGKENKAYSSNLALAEIDCLAVLDEVGMKPGKVLFHCFSSDRTMAEEVLQRGWHLSFSGVLTYPKADELREVVKICPLDRMVVETDCPFLSPQKHRGSRNEPAFVVETARMVAELKNLDYEGLERQLDTNARTLFQLS
jgi:TatD DNase family protein